MFPKDTSLLSIGQSIFPQRQLPDSISKRDSSASHLGNQIRCRFRLKTACKPGRTSQQIHMPLRDRCCFSERSDVIGRGLLVGRAAERPVVQ